HWNAALVQQRNRQDMRGKGLGLVCQFLRAVLHRGVTVLTNQNVRRLAVDNGRVTGVILGSGEFIGARNGVVLATGGYGANPEMSWRFEQLPGFAHEASGLMPASLDRRWPRPRGRDRRNIAQGMRRQGQLLEQRSGVA